MNSIGYLIRVDLKKHLGDAPEESRSCLVLPSDDCTLASAEAAERASDLVLEAVRQVSRYPVIEEVSRRKVFVEDIRPLRNSLMLEKDGLRCFGLRA